MSEWISVEDELPEKYTVALVWCKKYGEFPFVCLYDDNEWLKCHCIKENVEASDITHWMPIMPPQPTKKGDYE